MKIQNQARLLQRRQQLRQSNRQLSLLSRVSDEIRDLEANKTQENLNLN